TPPRRGHPVVLVLSAGDQSSMLLIDVYGGPVRQALFIACPILDVTSQLAAGRGNIVTARLAHGGDHARVHENLGEQTHPMLGRPLQARLGERIEGNEVELATNLSRNVYELPGMLVGIVDAI